MSAPELPRTDIFELEFGGNLTLESRFMDCGEMNDDSSNVHINIVHTFPSTVHRRITCTPRFEGLAKEKTETPEKGRM